MQQTLVSHLTFWFANCCCLLLQMHVHEGMIQDSPRDGITHKQHQQQVWMCSRLNELGWQKCAVDTK